MLEDADLVVLDPDDMQFAVDPEPRLAAMNHSPFPADATAAFTKPAQHSAVPLEHAPMGGAFLAHLAARAAAGLVRRPDALALLAEIGITDRETLAAFGVGAGDDTLLDGVNKAQRKTMANSGLWCRGRSPLTSAGFVIPTRDPRDYGTVLGFVKVSPCQLKYGHLGAAAGIACTADITNSRCIVITDNPLLMLRLHQAGVRGVVLAEGPSVLPPLLDWFDGRELIVASYKAVGSAAMRAALGPHGERAVPVLIPADLARSAAETLAILGINGQAVRVEESPPVITPFRLRDIHEFAVGRLEHPDARAALDALGVADPELVRAWGLGFLPIDFRMALSAELRNALAGKLRANAVLVPAFDEAGAVVDLACIQGYSGGYHAATMWDAPRGLVGAVAATAFDRLSVTDSFRQAVRWFSAGDQATIWLRGVVDATANAARLAAAGVRSVAVRCRRDAEAIAKALSLAGIEVERNGAAAIAATEGPAVVSIAPMDVGPDHPTADVLTFPVTTTADSGDATQPSAPEAVAPPSPYMPLVLVRHDPAREEAVFRSGDLTITAQVPWGDETMLRVTLACHDRRCADRIDVAVPAQRRRFAGSAALRLDLHPAAIDHALAGLRDALRIVVDAEQAPTVSPVASLMTDAEQAESLVDLRSGDIVARVLRWLGTLGMPGDDDGTLLLFLSALSRKSDNPVWMALVTTSPSAAQAVDVIAAATPPEELIAASRLTDNALVNTDDGALRHRLLVLHDAECVSQSVGTALRIMRRRGALSGTKVERDPIRGDVRTTFVETRGPVAVLTASTGRVDERLRPCVVELPADESPAQVERLLAAERSKCADPRRHAAARVEALRRLRNLQRLVVPRSVLMPFADDVTVPAVGPNAQRDQAALLALVVAHALLHQHQRLSDDGVVVATKDDLAAARMLAARWAGGTGRGLGPHAAGLLAAIQSAGVRSVSIDQLEAMLPGWSRHALRTGLAELVAVDHLSSPRVGRGHRRHYQVVRATHGTITYDLREHEVCGLAEAGEEDENGVNLDRKSG